MCFGALKAGSALRNSAAVSSASTSAPGAYDVAHHFLAVDRVRHADGRGLDHVGVLHQERIDLDRRNLGAAADDQLLLAAGERQKAVGVERAEIAGAEAAAAMNFDVAIVAEIAERMIAEPPSST